LAAALELDSLIERARSRAGDIDVALGEHIPLLRSMFRRL